MIKVNKIILAGSLIFSLNSLFAEDGLMNESKLDEILKAGKFSGVKNKNALDLEPMKLQTTFDDEKVLVKVVQRYVFDIPEEEFKSYKRIQEALYYGYFSKASYHAFQLFQDNTVRKEDDLRTAVSLLSMGDIQLALGFPLKAWPYHSKALKIFEAYRKKDHKKYDIDYILALQSIGESMAYQKDLADKAASETEYSSRKIESLFRSVDRVKLASAILKEAEVSYILDRRDFALNAIERAVKFAPKSKGGFSLEYANTLISAGEILEHFKHARDAERYSLLGIRMIKGMIKQHLFDKSKYEIDDNYYMIGKGIRTLSRIYAKQGKIKKAIYAEKKAIAIFEEAYKGKESKYVMESYIELTELLLKRKNYEEAELALNKSLSIAKLYVGEKSIEVAFIYSKISQVQFKNKKYKNATESMQRSYDIYSEVLGWWAPKAKMTKESLDFIDLKYKESIRF